MLRVLSGEAPETADTEAKQPEGARARGCLPLAVRRDPTERHSPNPWGQGGDSQPLAIMALLGLLTALFRDTFTVLASFKIKSWEFNEPKETRSILMRRRL